MKAPQLSFPQVRMPSRAMRAAAVLTLGIAAGGLALDAFAAPIGPVYPPPGGVTFSASGASSASDAGGRNFNFSSFDNSAFSNLYWGPSTDNLPSAALDGSLDAMTFLGIAGTAATWETTSSWFNPTTLTTSPETIRLTITISGLGTDPWLLAPSVGLPALSGLGAVVDNSVGANFTANIAFTVPSEGNAALNALLQSPSCSPSPCTRSNFQGGFYYNVPEPGSVGLAGLGLIGIAVTRRWAPKKG